MQHPIPTGVGGYPCQHPVPPRPAWHKPLARPVSVLAAEEPRETDLLRGAAGQACGRVRGWALTCRQLRALFTKRMLHARRSTRGFFAQVGPRGGDGAGHGAGWGRANPDPPLPPRSSSPPSSSASRCSSASSCRPSGSTRRCSSSPGCTGSSSPFSGVSPALCPPCPSSPTATSSLLCLPAATTPRETPTRPGCWTCSWPSPASAPSA